MNWFKKEKKMNWDTSKLYEKVIRCSENKDKLGIIEALSGVSPYRMKIALKSNKDFNNLKLNEIVNIESIIDIYGE